jgi:hypothetical protein
MPENGISGNPSSRGDGDGNGSDSFAERWPLAKQREILAALRQAEAQAPARTAEPHPMTAEELLALDAARRQRQAEQTPATAPERVDELDAPDSKSILRAELVRFCERAVAAERRAQRATTIADREAAEWERLEAAGDFWKLETELADLFLMLFRFALRHQREALTAYLANALRPELEPLADLLAKLEAGR